MKSREAIHFMTVLLQNRQKKWSQGKQSTLVDCFPWLHFLGLFWSKTVKKWIASLDFFFFRSVLDQYWKEGTWTLLLLLYWKQSTLWLFCSKTDLKMKSREAIHFMTVLLQNRPKKMKSRETIHFMTVLLQNRPKNEVKGSNPLYDCFAPKQT
jgi:hypothetical protein